MSINHHLKLIVGLMICARTISSHDRTVEIKRVNFVLSKEAQPYDTSCHNKTVVCELDFSDHHTNNGEPSFKISEVDPSLCTHILYRQAELDDTTLAINDNPNGHHGDLYKEVVKLQKRNPNLQLLLSVGGGGTPSTSAKAYGSIAGDSEKRRAFGKSVVHLLEKYKFQGVDVAWREAGFQHKGGSVEDFSNMRDLLGELRTSLHNYLLTLTLKAVHGRMFKNHLWDSLSLLVDHIHVETFDNGGLSPVQAYHYASLYENLEEIMSLELMVLSYTQGIAAGKLVPLLPSHGKAFLLKTEESKSAGLGGETTGSYTVDRPSFTEICQNLTRQQGWTPYFDKTCQVPFAKRGRWWLSFDDLDSVKLKVKFVMKMGLKGVGLSSIYNDDFTGSGCGLWLRYPILRTINHGIALSLGSVCPSNQDSYEDDTRASLEYLLILGGVGLIIFVCFVVVVVVWYKKTSHNRVSSIKSVETNTITDSPCSGK